jgi:hypothetical protein
MSTASNDSQGHRRLGFGPVFIVDPLRPYAPRPDRGWFSGLQADAVVFVYLALEFSQALVSHARFLVRQDEYQRWPLHRHSFQELDRW